ncbi:hypothetical protein FS842_002296 [Serendipita sp. 407]|nr:hypothetical protein FS842_002296 [Serendipita sp. 407]
MAAAFKLKGNDAFKSGNFAAAVGAYTDAMLADPKDPTLPLNRAAAYLKLNKCPDFKMQSVTAVKCCYSTRRTSRLYSDGAKRVPDWVTTQRLWSVRPNECLWWKQGQSHQIE